MCSGRVDLSFVIRAFMKGTDGVFVGGCRLNECNYITHGNYDAMAMVYLCRKIMARIGLDPERLRVEFMSSGDGIIFTEVINDFGARVSELGPIGRAEGMDEEELELKLEAVNRLIPYIKLVERERLRPPQKSEEAYRRFYEGEDADRLFNELIGDRLEIGQIMLLLEKNPLSTGEIAESLGLSPSEVSRYMNISSRQGLVSYDEAIKRYAAA